MMESAIQIVSVCLICTVLISLVKGTSPAIALCISGAVCVAALLFIAAKASDILQFAETVISESGLEGELFTPLLKVVAIASLCRLSGEICRDAGENAIASITELVGTMLGILTSLPLLEAVWELLSGLL